MGEMTAEAMHAAWYDETVRQLVEIALLIDAGRANDVDHDDLVKIAHELRDDYHGQF